MHIALMVPTLAWADGHLSDALPSLVEVTGVASNDSLNVRIDPDHTTEIVGELVFNATDVEVVAH